MAGGAGEWCSTSHNAPPARPAINARKRMPRFMILNFQFVFVSVIAVCARRKNLGQITGTKLREQRNRFEKCRLEAHFGRGIEMFRSAKRNSARKAECGSPSRAKKGRRRARAPASRARSRSTRPAQGSMVDFEMKKEPEPQGQAAAPEKRAQRNRPCHNGNRHEQRAQLGPPGLGRGGWASRPATGCKQWPASFSRFEYHPAG